MALALPDAVLSVARPQRDVAVAISACLVGQAVRCDRGHKRSSLCHECLDSRFSGAQRAPLYSPSGVAAGYGSGVYAGHVMKRLL